MLVKRNSPEPHFQSVPLRPDFSKSYFLLIGSNTNMLDGNDQSQYGILEDIFKLKKLLISSEVNFDKNNIEQIISKPKKILKERIEFYLKKDDIENLFLYFAVNSDINTQTNEFEIHYYREGENMELITSTELFEYIGNTNVNLIIFFDGDKGEKLFETFYKRNAFIISSVGFDKVVIDSNEGGIFVKNLENVINTGIDNSKEFLTLSDIFVALREKQYKESKIEPKLFTTNIVQYLEFAKNKRYVDAKVITKVNVEETKNTLTVNKTILLISSSPRDMTLANVGIEAQTISTAIKYDKTNTYRFEQNAEVHADSLIESIIQYNPFIIHFYMHNGNDGLYLSGKNGIKTEMSPDDLSIVFNYVTQENYVDLIVLNACNSENHVEKLLEFVPNIIYTVDFIPFEQQHNIASHFTKYFYKAIFEGKNYEAALKITNDFLTVSKYPLANNSKFSNAGEIYKLKKKKL